MRQTFYIFLIFALVAATWSFMTGLHSIDNAWNLHTVNEYLGTEWCDQALELDYCYTEAEAYMIGLLLVFASFATVTLTCFIIIILEAKGWMKP